MLARQLQRLLRAVAAASALTLGACAGLLPPKVAPGTPRTQVLQTLGVPSNEYRVAGAPADSPYLQIDSTGNAVRRLEYSRGIYDRVTYMFDFDAGDRLLAMAQVRTEARFNAIRAGMAQDAVLRVLGRPSNIRRLDFQAQNVWGYRYESPFCQWFQVGMGYDGRVADTAYGPDPFCLDGGDHDAN